MISDITSELISFPPGTEMFHFPGFPAQSFDWAVPTYHRNRFPHSEILGSKVARHLPEAYRSHATSFIGSLCQGILHRPLFYPAPFLTYLVRNSPPEVGTVPPLAERTSNEAKLSTFLILYCQRTLRPNRPYKKTARKRSSSKDNK